MSLNIKLKIYFFCLSFDSTTCSELPLDDFNMYSGLYLIKAVVSSSSNTGLTSDIGKFRRLKVSYSRSNK